jgi:hypothetical protein
MIAGLTNTIIERLKSGTIQNVVLYSDVETFPEPPYVVIKPEPGLDDNTRRYRIIVHNTKGFFDQLEHYTLQELDLLLAGTLVDEENSHFILSPSGYTDITADDGDNTYFMERIYTVPLLLRG